MVCYEDILYYDPASATTDILNYFDSAVYIYRTCEDSLSNQVSLSLFISVKNRGTDAKGNKMKDTSSPYYRINAYSYGDIYASGTLEKPLLPCEGKNLTLFYIKEITMRKKPGRRYAKISYL